MILLTLLAAVTIAIIQQRELFGVVVLSGVYSFLMASVMIVLDAVDVAMTEASVGAGISTVLLLATLHLTKARESRRLQRPYVPLAVALFTGAALVWGTQGMPKFGAANTPMHTHVAPRYLKDSLPVMGVPNVVTTVLANYRSFDTFGEVTVVFTAGLGVMILLRGRRKGKKKKPKGKGKTKGVKPNTSPAQTTTASPTEGAR